MSQVRPIQAVAFDLDGLMFNTEDLYDEVAQLVLQRRGHEFSLELKLAMMGLPGLQAIERLCTHCGIEEPHDAVLHELHSGVMDLLPVRIRTMPGLERLLDLTDELGLPRSIATSSSPVFAARCLELAGLADRFRFILTADDVAQGKPHPDIYLLTAQRHGVPASSLLVLEDSVHGSRAGAAAGSWTVAVPGHHSAGQDFRHVDLVARSLDDPALEAFIRRRRMENAPAP